MITLFEKEIGTSGGLVVGGTKERSVDSRPFGSAPTRIISVSLTIRKTTVQGERRRDRSSFPCTEQ